MYTNTFNVELIKAQDMEHKILTETSFFKYINTSISDDADLEVLQSAYNDFVTSVINLCHTPALGNNANIAFIFAETELQYHHLLSVGNIGIYIKKALAFLRKMMRHHSEMPPPQTSTSREKENQGLQWTGSVVEMVEMIYGFDELRCINNGEFGIKEMLSRFGKIFGMNLNDTQCYNTYKDMKRRKNDSRTYFFDKLSEKLNDRMDRDDERERMRR